MKKLILSTIQPIHIVDDLLFKLMRSYRLIKEQINFLISINNDKNTFEAHISNAMQASQNKFKEMGGVDVYGIKADYKNQLENYDSPDAKLQRDQEISDKQQQKECLFNLLQIIQHLKEGASISSEETAKLKSQANALYSNDLQIILSHLVSTHENDTAVSEFNDEKIETLFSSYSCKKIKSVTDEHHLYDTIREIGFFRNPKTNSTYFAESQVAATDNHINKDGKSNAITSTYGLRNQASLIKSRNLLHSK